MEANKCVGILTSGGDAPGMNAAIRAVTRAAIYNGFEVKGIMRGYRGLITDEIIPFQTQNVSNIIQQGGTILKTARCEEFRTPEGRKTAYDNIVKHGITSLVVIGGDGSLTGARIFAEEYNFPIVGLPGTIDNDLYGTDTTIGYDTALNTIMQSVDKIRDTATSHERLFFIEVMGREAGFLALNGAIASGAEAAIIPEIAMEVDQLDQLIENGFRKSKNSSIVLVAESELTGGAMGLAERVKNEYPQYDVRVTILGHIQRGGSPTASDRIMASRMGEAAINALLEDQRNVMIGIQNDELVYIPFSRAIKCQKPIFRPSSGRKDESSGLDQQQYFLSARRRFIRRQRGFRNGDRSRRSTHRQQLFFRQYDRNRYPQHLCGRYRIGRSHHRSTFGRVRRLEQRYGQNPYEEREDSVECTAIHQSPHRTGVLFQRAGPRQR